MGVPVVDTGPMTVEDFYAFTDTRPDEEKWELIDGEPLLKASPAYVHQQIVNNILYSLETHQRPKPQWWTGIPGIGIRISNTRRPEPDGLIRSRSAPTTEPMGRDCDDVIVACEVLSPSTKDRDLRWKCTAYAELPSLTHYVVIAQDVVDVVVFARAAGFGEQRLRTLQESVELPNLGVSLTLADIHRGAGLGQ